MASIVKKIRAGNYESDDNNKAGRKHANKRVRQANKVVIARLLNEDK